MLSGSTTAEPACTRTARRAGRAAVGLKAFIGAMALAIVASRLMSDLERGMRNGSRSQGRAKCFQTCLTFLRKWAPGPPGVGQLVPARRLHRSSHEVLKASTGCPCQCSRLQLRSPAGLRPGPVALPAALPCVHLSALQPAPAPAAGSSGRQRQRRRRQLQRTQQQHPRRLPVSGPKNRPCLACLSPTVQRRCGGREGGLDQAHTEPREQAVDAHHGYVVPYLLTCTHRACRTAL